MSEFFDRALFATRQLAKRQTTWMRSWKDLKKYDISSKEEIKEEVESLSFPLNKGLWP